jgi:hypothetical protein
MLYLLYYTKFSCRTQKERLLFHKSQLCETKLLFSCKQSRKISNLAFRGSWLERSQLDCEAVIVVEAGGRSEAPDAILEADEEWE